MSQLRRDLMGLWHGPRSAVTVVALLLNVAVFVVVGSVAVVVNEQDQHVLSAHQDCAEALIAKRGLPEAAVADLTLGEPRFVGDNMLRIPFTWTGFDPRPGGPPRSGTLLCRFEGVVVDKRSESRVVSVEVLR